jgi:hypothetical protein
MAPLESILVREAAANAINALLALVNDAATVAKLSVDPKP